MKIRISQIALFLTLSIIALSCKKTKTEIDTCTLDSCDPKRKTLLTVTNDTGQLGYYNDLRKWAVNVHIRGTYDSVRTCIICTDIPDSLKTLGKTVVFSGELKESCGVPAPTFYGQGIFFVTPTKLR